MIERVEIMRYGVPYRGLMNGSGVYRFLKNIMN